MKIVFTTETGSTYLLDSKRETWERLTRTGKSGGIRKESGWLVCMPDVILGQPCAMETTDVQPGCARHFVHTSAVVSKEEEL